MKIKSAYFCFLICACLYCYTNAQNIYTFAGTGIAGNTGDGGTSVLAQVGNPCGIVSDAAGNIYFGSGNLVRKVNSAGIISTIAGGGTLYGDGGPATSAKLMAVYGITIDSAGNIYIADRADQCIRKVNTSGIITTVAGNNISGFFGDGGSATLATLHDPVDVALDNAGNIYIADAGNYRIRMVDAAGVIKTIAGNGNSTYNGDGIPAINAQIEPQTLLIDPLGNILVSDFSNARIRSINTAGIINTIAGTGTLGYAGDGGSALSAQISQPRGLCFDGSGNLYFGDRGNQTVRKIDLSGIINTVAGTGVLGYSGDNGPAISAQLNQPQRITIDVNGKLYITDIGNQRIRVVVCSSGSGCITGMEEQSKINNFMIYPNPTADILQVLDEENRFQNSNIEIVNYLGQNVLMQSYADVIDVSKLPNGIYTLKIEVKNKQSYFSKFVKE